MLSLPLVQGEESENIHQLMPWAADRNLNCSVGGRETPVRASKGGVVGCLTGQAGNGDGKVTPNAGVTGTSRSAHHTIPSAMSAKPPNTNPR